MGIRKIPKEAVLELGSSGRKQALDGRTPLSLSHWPPRKGQAFLRFTAGLGDYPGWCVACADACCVSPVGTRISLHARILIR